MYICLVLLQEIRHDAPSHERQIISLTFIWQKRVILQSEMTYKFYFIFLLFIHTLVVKFVQHRTVQLIADN